MWWVNMPRASFGNTDILKLIQERTDKILSHDNDFSMWENLKAIKTLCELMLE